MKTPTPALPRLPAEADLPVDHARALGPLVKGSVHGGRSIRGTPPHLLTSSPPHLLKDARHRRKRSELAELEVLLTERARWPAAALVQVQRHALWVALLRADAEGAVDQRAISTALVSLLTHLAQKGPVVVAVDDAQWLDTTHEVLPNS